MKKLTTVVITMLVAMMANLEVDGADFTKAYTDLTSPTPTPVYKTYAFTGRIVDTDSEANRITVTNTAGSMVFGLGTSTNTAAARHPVVTKITAVNGKPALVRDLVVGSNVKVIYRIGAHGSMVVTSVEVRPEDIIFQVMGN